MKRWPNHIRRHGWPAAGAASLTLVAVVGALWLPREQARLDAQRQTVSARRLAVQRAPLPPPLDSGAFARSLPPDSERQARTVALLTLTTEQGLPWPRSEFRFQADRELGLGQYRIAMTVTGRYDALRGFIAEALRRDPALALEGARLRRQSNGELKAELAWVLNMQAAR